MPRSSQTHRLNTSDVRAYGAKAEEYLEAAEQNLTNGRYNAATSAAVHAGINAADAITGALKGARSADPHHWRAVDLLGACGRDGKEASKHLARLVPLKPKAEYDPRSIPRARAESAVRNAAQLVEIARRVITETS